LFSAQAHRRFRRWAFSIEFKPFLAAPGLVQIASFAARVLFGNRRNHLPSLAYPEFKRLLSEDMRGSTG